MLKYWCGKNYTNCLLSQLKLEVVNFGLSNTHEYETLKYFSICPSADAKASVKVQQKNYIPIFYFIDVRDAHNTIIKKNIHSLYCQAPGSQSHNIWKY